MFLGFFFNVFKGSFLKVYATEITYDTQSVGYLLSGPEYEKFADPSSKEDVRVELMLLVLWQLTG